MRLNAKTTSVFAAASVIVLGGVVLTYRKLYSDSVPAPLTDIPQSVFTYIHQVLKSVGSTSVGRIGALVALVLIVDVFFLGWKRSSLFRLIFNRSKSATLDSLYFVIVLLNLTAFIEIAFTLGISIEISEFIAWVSSYYSWSRITLPTHGIIEIAGSFAIYWLMMSFVQYWGHRLMHTPLFWHAHRFHHAATELNAITAFRVNPVETVVLRPLLLVSPLIFFNIPASILLMYFVLGTISDLLAHSQLPWGYGWIGRWLIQSPRVHQVHHSVENEHQDLHFSVCPLWDHLFGTWYKGTRQPSKFGIKDSAYEVRPLTQFVLDVWIFYTNIARWVCSPLQRLTTTSINSQPARNAAHQSNSDELTADLG
jgi:sterol desaturase/sphingolipid hydroxylase (fatty acid hydroxylase superfamily)